MRKTFLESIEVKRPKPYIEAGAKFLRNCLRVMGVVLGLLILDHAMALGLGNLELRSNIDEPLDGIIELRVSEGEDISGLNAYIASRSEFFDLGIDYPDYLDDIVIELEQLSGQTQLRVRSEEVVIKEPFIHLLVRVDWVGGSFLREYTALIDPPVYAAETPSSVAEPKVVGSDSFNTVNDAILEAETLDDSQVFEEAYEEPASSADFDDSSEPMADSNTFDSVDEQDQRAQYGPVESGESLSIIAAELQQRFPDLSIYQIMKVLFDENPSAFIDNNINGLIQGAILNISDLGAIRAVDLVEAKTFFSAQVNEWEQSAIVASSDDSLRIGQDNYLGVDDDLYSDDSFDSDINQTNDDGNFQIGSSSDTQPFVSNSEGNSREGEVIALRQELAEVQASLSSSELENQELTERISILEGQLADLNRLVSLDVEDADLASVEATLAQQNDAREQENDGGGLAPSEKEYVDSIVNEINSLSVTDGLETQRNTSTQDIQSVITPEETQSDTDSVVDTETLAPSVETSNTAQSTTMKVQSKSWFDSSLWKVLAAFGAVLLGFLAIIFVRRRRIDEEFEISMLSLEISSQRTDSVNRQKSSGHGARTRSEAEAESTDKETSFLTVYSDSDAVVQADEVDPIAEADVYIAYGRDEQAEEVLLDGIASFPGRMDIKHKLLGLYYKNQNGEQFERIAEEVYAARDALDTGMWQDIVRMGKEITPANPLFDVSAEDLLATGQAVDANADDEHEEANYSQLQADSSVSEPSGVVNDDQGDIASLLDQEFELESESDNGDEIEIMPEAESDSDEESIGLVDFDEDQNETNSSDELGIGELGLEDSGEGVIEIDLSEDVVDFDSNLEPAFEFTEDASSQKTLVGGKEGDNAIDELKEVSDLEIDDDYDEARTQFELAKVFVDLGDEDGARKILNDIMSSSNADGDVHAAASELLDSINS